MDAAPRTDTAPLFHLALAPEWDEAVAAGGPYRRSTVGASLDEVGFVHCSFEHQVEATRERYYSGRGDVVLLTIDPGRLEHPVLVEDDGSTGDGHPHLYGPLELAAVVAVQQLRP